jgi:hypothetical protein
VAGSKVLSTDIACVRDGRCVNVRTRMQPQCCSKSSQIFSPSAQAQQETTADRQQMRQLFWMSDV